MAEVSIADGTYDVPNGKVAGIITHLDWARPEPTDPPASRAGIALQRQNGADPDWYRAIFRKIGEDWLWTSRLSYSDAKLAARLSDPGIEIYCLQRDGEDLGLLELDFRVEPDCEINLFGLAPELIGQRLGGWMMQHAKAKALQRGCTRVHLNTCTFDSPQALKFYMSQGFIATRRVVEVFDDPRLQGYLDRGNAPQIPVIE
ncbi:MAG: GNAT family N-acetyltransferase [Marinosulfonomonas sp.]